MYTEEKPFVPEFLVQDKDVVSATGSRSCTKFALDVRKDEVTEFLFSFFLYILDILGSNYNQNYILHRFSSISHVLFFF